MPEHKGPYKLSITHIPFYPSDWLGGTRNLSDAETGVYITLICHMYEMAGPIKRNDERFARFCGCKSKAGFVKSLAYLIGEGKITYEKGWLFNDKVGKVIQKVTEKSSVAKASAQRRWDKKPKENKDSTDANALRTHMQNGCYPKPKPKPVDDDDDTRTREILTDREIVLVAMGHDKSGATATGRMVGNQMDTQILNKWRDDLGLSMPEIETVISDITTRRLGRPPPVTFSYYNKPMQELAGQKASPKLIPIEGTYTNGKQRTDGSDIDAWADKAASGSLIPPPDD